MRRVWATADWIGTGTDEDPFRPDVDGLDAFGWAGYQLNGTRALVYLAVPDNLNDNRLNRTVRVIHGEDVQNERGLRLHVPDDVRAAIEDVLREHGREGADYDAINVNPRVT